MGNFGYICFRFHFFIEMLMSPQNKLIKLHEIERWLQKLHAEMRGSHWTLLYFCLEDVPWRKILYCKLLWWMKHAGHSCWWEESCATLEDQKDSLVKKNLYIWDLPRWLLWLWDEGGNYHDTSLALFMHFSKFDYKSTPARLLFQKIKDNAFISWGFVVSQLCPSIHIRCWYHGGPI